MLSGIAKDRTREYNTKKSSNGKRALRIGVNVCELRNKLDNFAMAYHQSVSAVRQNYHQDCEAGVNKQINLELYADYVYLSMASYFDRDDVALPGFAQFFRKSSDDERGHARKLIDFQNSRGGRVVLQNVQKPERDEWGTGLEAMQAALALEKSVNQSLLDLHKCATKHEDNHTTSFLEAHYLTEQVESIKELADHITNLKRVGPGLGEYTYDKETMHTD